MPTGSSDRPGAARLVLVCGLPGSGKTTLARRLAVATPAVRFCPDEWMAELGIDVYDEAARDRLEKLFWRHTQRLLALGTSVIIEFGSWVRAERDEMRVAARRLGVAVELRYLAVPMAELHRRVAARNASGDAGTVLLSPESLDHYATLFQAPDAQELALFDPPLWTLPEED